jgi:hypothetical protein
LCGDNPKYISEKKKNSCRWRHISYEGRYLGSPAFNRGDGKKEEAKIEKLTFVVVVVVVVVIVVCPSLREALVC